MRGFSAISATFAPRGCPVTLQAVPAGRELRGPLELPGERARVRGVAVTPVARPNDDGRSCPAAVHPCRNPCTHGFPAGHPHLTITLLMQANDLQR